MMKKIKKLGIFDSGLGGYSVYHDLHHHYPKLPLVLFADQKRSPYGTLAQETIIEYAVSSMQWFRNQGIDDVLLACNTVTSVALDQLHHKFPGMRIWGIVDLTVGQLNQQHIRKVGVVATQATVQSQAYTRSFKQKFSGEISEVALPKLVNAIESLWSDQEIEDLVAADIQSLEACSHVILGCTHYPLALPVFEKHFRGEIVDSLKPIREFVKDKIEESDESSIIYTTGSPEHFADQIFEIYRTKETVKGTQI